MGYQDKDGKEIDTSGIDEKTLGVVDAIVAGEIHRVTASIGETVTKAVSAAVETELAPLTAKIAEIETGKPKTDDADAPKTDIQTMIESALGPITEQLTKLTSERDAEQAARTSRQIAESFVAQHRPNLRGKEVLANRIAAAKVTSEQQAMKVADDWDAEMKNVLGEEGFTKLSADPEEEGATPAAEGADGDKQAQKDELLNKIRGRKPVAE